MSQAYTTEELRKLYETYHGAVHNLLSGVPCGEECGVEAFLTHLDSEETRPARERALTESWLDEQDLDDA
jgi:hypothetical protein